MPGSTAVRTAGHRRRALAAEIALTLTRLGGAAHRDTVCEAVAIARRRAGRATGKRLRTDLLAAFAAYCDLNPDRDGEAVMFTLPFGRESLRWALADAVGASWAARAQAPGRLSA